MSEKHTRRAFLTVAGSASVVGALGLSGWSSSLQAGNETGTQTGNETNATANETAQLEPVDEDYPESGRTIEYIVPFSEGGGTDTYARQIMPPVGEQLDVNVQIRNIPGGASLRGTGRIVQAESDGYTMGAFNPPSTPLSYLVFQPDYELSEVEGICTYARTPYVILTNPDAGVEDMDDLIGRFQDGEFSAIGGCQARGGLNHVAALVMRNEYGLEWENYVGYDGCGPVNQAVAGTEVPVSISTDTAAEGTVEAGRAEVVAVLQSAGSQVFPDAPTVTEQGFANIDYIGGLNRAMWFPPGTDEGKVNRMAIAVRSAVQSDELQQWSEETGNILEFGGPESANELLRNTLETLPEMVDIEQIREEAGG